MSEPNIGARNIGEMVGLGRRGVPRQEDLSGYGGVFARAQRRREQKIVRVCAGKGCTTKLNSYNDGDKCYRCEPNGSWDDAA